MADLGARLRIGKSLGFSTFSHLILVPKTAATCVCSNTGRPPVPLYSPKPVPGVCLFSISFHLIPFFLSLSTPPLSLLSIPPSSPSVPTHACLLFLEVSEVVQIGGTEELNDGRLLRGENNAVGVHPPEHACRHKGSHVGEVQFQCGRECFILRVPVSAASSQDKPMACHLAISQHD